MIGSESRVPLFCGTDLAERIERVEAQLIAKGSEAARGRGAHPAGFVTPIAGGVASFAEAGSPLNKVAGMGFGGVPTGADLDKIERAFAERGAPVQVELANLVDPEIGALLTGRSYRLASFENVLGLPLTGEHTRVSPHGIEVRPSGDNEFEQWLDVVANGFAHPDAQGVPSHEESPPEVIANAVHDLAAAGVRRYLARRDGVIAGGAGLRIAEGVAQLTGAATAPAHRRRGVHTALLSARLADAAAAGCDIAVVTAQPGSKSQQNAQRQGFDLLYTRAVLVKLPWSAIDREAMQVRIARQTGQLDDVVAFYRDGLGLPELTRFVDHDGYSGVMLDLPGTGAHLEFTSTQHVTPPTPQVEDLLVLYLGRPEDVDRLVAQAGVIPVPSANPYWDRVGATIVDPDGYRVVLVARSWPD